jgi:Subtilase family
MEEELIYAQASVHSLGGTSLFDADKIDCKNVGQFHSDKKLIQKAIRRLKYAGFQIIDKSPTTITIAAPRAVFEKVFNTTITEDTDDIMNTDGSVQTRSFLDSPDTDVKGLMPIQKSRLADVLEGVALAEAPIYFAPSPIPPSVNYWHLRVPDDLAKAFNADKVHQMGITGKGVKVVMTDTGWEPHPYFLHHKYTFKPTVLGAGAKKPEKDENGHGTAESANIFAIAPEIEFQMVKNSFDTVAAFKAAVALKPHIISCSWGFDVRKPKLTAGQKALAAAVAQAVSQGIIVIFSAGNGQWGFPAMHPDVISVGGVFKDQTGDLQASDYASSFVSPVYKNRPCPDVSGLVGMRPKAAYIMLPVPAGCMTDVSMSGKTHPLGDETLGNDGWAAISGTSAAAPQIAGVCALLRQKLGDKLTPQLAKKILMDSAIDVTKGVSSPAAVSQTAGVGKDLATGAGLVDAFKAVALAN